MNIAVVIKNTTLHSHYGGLETQNKTLCEGLVDRGHQVTVFSPTNSQPLKDQVMNNVSYIFITSISKKYSFLYQYRPDSWLNKSAQVLLCKHKENKFDLIISQSSAGLGLIRRKNIHKIPILSISHGSKMGEAQTRVSSINSFRTLIGFLLDVPHILRAFFITQRQFIHGSDQVVAVSNYVKQSLIQETYLVEDKIDVIHNGIDPQMFASYTRHPSKKVRLLYVGRIVRAKGVVFLLDVIAELVSEGSLQQKDFELTFIGGGEDLNLLKAKLEEYKLDCVKVIGSKLYEEVIEYFYENDIFVLPTQRVEGFPMVLVEAMFAGLPIISTSMGGNTDAVLHEETGLVIEAGNKLQLKTAIIKLVSRGDLREQYGKSAQNYANKNFTKDIMLDNYEKVFKKIL